MSMRVTNRASTRNYLRYLNNALYNQQNTMGQVQSGYRFRKISDNVSNGMKNMRTKAEMYKTNIYKDNVDSIKDKLDTVDTTMDSIYGIFTNLGTMINKAVSDTSAPERGVYAQASESAQSQVLQLLNTQYDNQYLFGGSNNYTAPFTQDAKTGELLYNHVPVDQIQQRDDGSYYYKDAKNGGQVTDVPMNEKVYMDIGLGLRMSGPNVDPSSGFDVTYSGPDMLGFGKDKDGQTNNIFNVINDLTTTLKSSPGVPSSAEGTHLSELGKKLQDMSKSFMTQRTQVGAKANFLGTLSDRLNSTADMLNQRMSSLVGTDTAKASTEEATDVSITNALYRMGSSIIPTSLMDFLK
ncbi:MAG: hypothetical protein LKF71_06500 [Oscillospiraceae bacterium]|nr:hypothetical protein [Oscillospiraceae bacterium]